MEPSTPGLLAVKPVEWGYLSQPPLPGALCSPHLVPPRPPLRLTDRPGVTRREEIEQVQEEMALTLQTYIKDQQPRPRNRYGDMGAWRGHGEGEVLNAT